MTAASSLLPAMLQVEGRCGGSSVESATPPPHGVERRVVSLFVVVWMMEQRGNNGGGDGRPAEPLNLITQRIPFRGVIISRHPHRAPPSRRGRRHRAAGAASSLMVVVNNQPPAFPPHTIIKKKPPSLLLSPKCKEENSHFHIQQPRPSTELTAAREDEMCPPSLPFPPLCPLSQCPSPRLPSPLPRRGSALMSMMRQRRLSPLEVRPPPAAGRCRRSASPRCCPRGRGTARARAGGARTILFLHPQA